MALPISWEVNVQVNYPGYSVWRQRELGQVRLAATLVVVRHILNSPLPPPRDKSVNKESAAQRVSFDLMAWTNEGRCDEITQLLPMSPR